MAHSNVHSNGPAAWELARRQHGVVARRQLLDLGFSPDSIKHRVAKGRLHPLWRGVYVVGRPQLTQLGRWMGAVLSCGPNAVLSHDTAAALWGIGPRGNRVHISVPEANRPRRTGILVHRRSTLVAADVTKHRLIPVTTPVCTLIDLATRLGSHKLEAAVNEADKRGLVDPDELRSALSELDGRPGVRALREVLDRTTFALTESVLERQLLAIAHEAGLPLPLTGQYVNGFKVDFYWPDLRLIVETDGLRYHRTAAQQTRDRLRDQAHTAAGLTCLRFTAAQVQFDREYVRSTLATVASLLG
jgi:very-short-patch-repair endonuclease